MKTLIFIALLFTSTTAFAEQVRVYTDYTPVRIIKKGDNTADFNAEAIKAGLSGSYKEVDSSAIPSDRSYRDSWKFEGGKVVENAELKKKLQDDRKEASDNKKSAIEN